MINSNTPPPIPTPMQAQTPVQAPNVNMSVSAPPAHNKRKIIIISLSVIVLLALAGLAVFIFMRKGAKAPQQAETESEVQAPGVPPISEFPKIPVSITSKGFEPNSLKIKKYTNVQLQNNTGKDFTYQLFIQSAAVNSKIDKGATQDFPLTGADTYKFVSQSDNSQTLEIIVE